MPYPKIVTSAQMRWIDRRSIDAHGIPGVDLMERAGRRVVEAIRQRWQGLEGLRIGVVCGKGNNGGDGFVVARQLRQAGVDVDIFLLHPPEVIQGDAAAHLALLRGAGGVPRQLEDPSGAVFAPCDLIVDAILGTGLQAAPRQPQARVIEALNASGRPLVAVDVPSGVDADSGIVPGVAIRAALTVTFGLPKVGHLFFPARSLCGDLELAEIGLPQEVIEACDSRLFLLTRDGIGRCLPQRSPTAHKGTCGTVAVVAGSAGMTGAAALAASSALLSGAGRVRVGVPASLHDLLEAMVTEAMTQPLPEVRRHRCLSLRAVGPAAQLAADAQALALGPGLGRHRETMELVRRLIVVPRRPPTVLDADGLYAISGDTGVLDAASSPLILTPHVGEMSRLSGLAPAVVGADPVGVASDFARRHHVVTLLKGAPTVVAAPRGEVFVNPTGNAGMATAGAGDVLTGVIAGLLAQGVDPVDAACTGAYLHGAAGDEAREAKGEWGMTAGDIRDHLPGCFVAAHRAGRRRDRGAGPDS